MTAQLDELVARFGRVKDRASRLGDEEGRVLRRRLALMRDRERALRYQLRQLGSARAGAATLDLEHGLTIACEQLTRELSRLQRGA